jgi:uncharacterized membrane protein
MDFIRWVESSRLSIWASENTYAYFGLLVCHVWGMAFLVGGGIAVSLRVFGVAAAVPLERFARFIPVVWVGGVLAAVSGIGLLIAYPAKTLTNWVFALKLACLVAAALLLRRMVRQYLAPTVPQESLPERAKVRAAVLLLLWVGVLVCGKLLPYTYVMLSSPASADISVLGF